MSDALNKAAMVLAPTEGSCFGQATSATAARYEIPEKWKGSWVQVAAKAADLYIVFGDSSVDVQAEKNNTVTSEAITLADDVGGLVFAGTKEDFLVPKHRFDASGNRKEVTHFAVEATATGRIEMRLSGKESKAT